MKVLVRLDIARRTSTYENSFKQSYSKKKVSRVIEQSKSENHRSFVLLNVCQNLPVNKKFSQNLRKNITIKLKLQEFLK